MIHVFVGTKAQLIKMAPIMQVMTQQGIPYNFIDAGQHRGVTKDLIHEFELRPPDILMREDDSNISTIPQALLWTLRHFWRILFRPRYIFQTIFRGQKGICLIHGDTLTTLISLLYAKRGGIKVAHVEAGLRSFHLFDPFPEEIIRLIAMRFSDVLFAPTQDTIENLQKLGYQDKTVPIGANTIADTVRYARQKANGQHRPSQPYVVVTSHRVETIYSRPRLLILVDLIERMAQKRQILFVLHAPTRQQLERFDLWSRLQSMTGVTLLPLQPYLIFLDLLAGADFVVTDGGSIQEECYLLNMPCLIMRNKTERIQGLGEVSYLAEFDETKINHFLQRFSTLKRENIDETVRPSAKIVEHSTAWA